MEGKKERLDILITEKGMTDSREKARSQIMSGIVYVNGLKVDKPGTKIAADSAIEIKGNALPYVSRGGLKLEKAINHFGISLKGLIGIDIGASTGGFTDCMLKNGAVKVTAIDVGYGQLAWSLRTDSRVVCMERTNIRYVTPSMLEELADFASIDVSFISLTKVLPAAKDLLKENGRLVCLIKPQFEAGKEKVGKKGVVRDRSVHHEVITKITEFCMKDLALSIIGLTYSPIRGPEGNIEYLLYISKENIVDGIIDINNVIDSIVDEANGFL